MAKKNKNQLEPLFDESEWKLGPLGIVFGPEITPDQERIHEKTRHLGSFTKEITNFLPSQKMIDSILGFTPPRLVGLMVYLLLIKKDGIEEERIEEVVRAVFKAIGPENTAKLISSVEGKKSKKPPYTGIETQEMFTLAGTIETLEFNFFLDVCKHLKTDGEIVEILIHNDTRVKELFPQKS